MGSHAKAGEKTKRNQRKLSGPQTSATVGATRLASAPKLSASAERGRCFFSSFFLFLEAQSFTRPGGIFRARLPRFPTTGGLCEFCLLRLPLRRLADTSGGTLVCLAVAGSDPTFLYFCCKPLPSSALSRIVFSFVDLFLFSGVCETATFRLHTSCDTFTLTGTLRCFLCGLVLPAWFCCFSRVHPPDLMVCAQDADLSYIFP